MTEKLKMSIFFRVSIFLFLFSFGFPCFVQGEEKKALSVLLTNDDGIDAPGLAALYKELISIAKVTVIAPQENKSGTGHSITIRTPLRMKEFSKNGKLFGYALNGTPADCVKFGLNKLLKQQPDIIISGINKGANVGMAVFYSGTIAGAREGAIHGIPSIAASMVSSGKETVGYGFAAKFVKNLALLVRKNRIPPGIILNVNIPAKGEEAIKGVAITRQRLEDFPIDYEERADTFKRTYYWMALDLHPLKLDPETDAGVVAKGMISITPLQIDLTRYDLMEMMKQWNFE